VIKRRVTYTNPDNGVSVVEHWVFSSTNEIVSGLESGAHTRGRSFSSAPERFASLPELFTDDLAKTGFVFRNRRGAYRCPVDIAGTGRTERECDPA
jgi:hypothetical protein